MLQSSGLSGHNPQDYQVTILRIVRPQSVRLSGHNLYGCQGAICTVVRLQSVRLSRRNLYDCQGAICTIVWPQSVRLSGRNLHDCFPPFRKASSGIRRERGTPLPRTAEELFRRNPFTLPLFCVPLHRPSQHFAAGRVKTYWNPEAGHSVCKDGQGGKDVFGRYCLCYQISQV